MGTAQWPQEMVVRPIEEIVVTNNNNKNTCANLKAVERKPRPQKEAALNCPRCHSTNTKFCYYNNYSLTQPRYFCKTCRRYWTEGGSLRNIPVGGGSRKNKRSSSSSSNSSASPKNLPDLVTVTPRPSTCSSTPQNPKIRQGQDLKLAFPDFGNISELVQQNNNHNSSLSAANSAASSSSATATSASTCQLSALELLTGITSSSRGLNSFMPLQPDPDPNSVCPCGFPPLRQDFKPTLNFSLDGIGSVQDTGGRLLFPFENLKAQVSTTTASANTMEEHQHTNNNKKDSTVYWTGMMGGSGSW